MYRTVVTGAMTVMMMMMMIMILLYFLGLVVLSEERQTYSERD
jgi:hypothetical protein